VRKEGEKMSKEKVAKKLIALRGDRSREEVAESVDISVSALQMYENGQRMPRDDIKIRIANYYGISVQQLFFEHQPHEMCGDEHAATSA
jgi:putative transcriptional regulator